MNEKDSKPQYVSGFLPTYKGCIVCGNREQNPHTLGLRFRATAEGAETTYVSDPRQEGYMNVVHGGIASALLDETIGWACSLVQKKYFVTVELSIRFRRPLPVGVPVTIRGRATKHTSRFSEGEGEITGSDGTIYTTAKARYFVIPDNEAKRVHDYLTFRSDDIDVLE